MIDFTVHMNDVDLSNFHVSEDGFTVTSGNTTIESHKHSSRGDAPDYNMLTIKSISAGSGYENYFADFYNVKINLMQLDFNSYNKQIDISFSVPDATDIEIDNVINTFTSQDFTIHVNK
ncbi:hypothetical protein [Candidatus Neoehrlichia procyonis]|uniref:Uncharacterized protein n=1 Tax=Candidatus Neoehrlichia procyonis str. RAC413 TaxID=1359163 RepID=A0A0F3NMJ6_9RICK|nr:hypothetical protein [Candidatus Neoehrlichia lotoris]KJV69265.1 hypothetical protein NLO413_0648 [Candidatus Neoehrlichia lotoris str. RAC413]